MRQQLKIQAGSIAPPMSIEEVKAMLDTTEKGGVRNSIKNCLTVFQHDPLLSGAIADNLLTDRTDIVKPIGYDRSPGTSMTDTDMKYIRLYLEENYDLTSEKKIIDAADLAAHQNSYHPVRDYLNSLAWDGIERIRYCLHHFLGTEADEYTFQALRLFLLGAIHRALYRYHAANLHVSLSSGSIPVQMPSQHKDWLFHVHAATSSDHKKSDISSYR